MKAKGKWVIDTNVIVYWLMAKQIMHFLIAEFKLGQLGEAFHDTYANRYKHSLDFVDKILELEDGGEFFVAELSLNELFSAIRDEIRTVMLFMKGVPLSKWTRETHDVIFPVGLPESTHKLILEGFDLLFGEGKIEIVPTVAPSDEADYFELYSSLIFLNPKMRTQDAMLVAHAIFEEIDHFVTTDEALIGLGQILKKEYSLEIVSPQRASQIMKSHK